MSRLYVKWTSARRAGVDDLSVPGHEVIQNRVDISPDAPPIKHKHPGEEIIYVLDGSLECQVEGKPPMTVKAGEVFFVPAERSTR
jgi:quercetin dioxygenase-like cupin family protein